MQFEIENTKFEVTEINPEFSRENGYLIIGKTKDGDHVKDIIRAPNKRLASETFLTKHSGVLQAESSGVYELGILPMKEFEIKQIQS